MLLAENSSKEYAPRGDSVKMRLSLNLLTSLYHQAIFVLNHARYFFQQLLSGVSYCHSMEICHRDLKLENTLLDGSPTPRVKICDFGYSKSALLHSKPKSTVGTPAYIAPEVLSRKEYDGKRILGVQYSIPDYVRVSSDCRRLLSQIFTADPSKRITIAEIKKLPWYLKSLPKEIAERDRANFKEPETEAETAAAAAQPVEEIMRIIQEAKAPGDMSKSSADAALLAELAELQSDEEEEEPGAEGETY
ncbi:unnamed protein product [Triticum turgidum subsp. durum]|uniref:non-specific serine/threonine protein kinase n=1 Tax=Triticum turgidum subsp. durum TaxID=4567 RepID=A0A9R0QV15_TRITD|nr:unnamed protein product [Triticum turgidum subsp. durum]